MDEQVNALVTPPTTNPTSSPAVVSPPPQMSVNTSANRPKKKVSAIAVSIMLLILFAIGAGLFVAREQIFRTGNPVEIADTSQNAVRVVRPTLQPTPQSLFLTVETPSDGDVTIGDTVTVTGKTLPHSVVLAFTDTRENSVESDLLGYYSVKVPLDTGINTVNVTAYGESGEEKSVLIDLVRDSQ